MSVDRIRPRWLFLTLACLSAASWIGIGQWNAWGQVEDVSPRAGAPVPVPAPAQTLQPGGPPQFNFVGPGAERGSITFGGPGHDPEAQQWNQTVLDLVKKYSAAQEDSERDELRQQLNSVVAKLFDRRQAAQARELKELEEQVNKLRRLHERRTQAKNDIVRNRVEQLLRQAEGLGWGTPDEWTADPWGFGGGPSTVHFGGPGQLPVHVLNDVRIERRAPGENEFDVIEDKAADSEDDTSRDASRRPSR